MSLTDIEGEFALRGIKAEEEGESPVDEGANGCQRQLEEGVGQKVVPGGREGGKEGGREGGRKCWKGREGGRDR